MSVNPEQALEWMRYYRHFGEEFKRFSVAEGMAKEVSRAYVVESYYLLSKVVPLERRKNLYEGGDGAILLEVLGSEEVIRWYFPSLFSEGDN